VTRVLLTAKDAV